MLLFLNTKSPLGYAVAASVHLKLIRILISDLSKKIIVYFLKQTHYSRRQLPLFYIISNVSPPSMVPMYFSSRNKYKNPKATKKLFKDGVETASHNSQLTTPVQTSPAEFPSLLGSLTSLRPQLHQQIHHRITTNRKQHHNPRIPPPIKIILQINRVKIIIPTSILANLTSTRGTRICQVGSRTRPHLIRRQVLPTSLSRGRVKESEFRLGAVDWRRECGECEQRAHEVVKRV